MKSEGRKKNFVLPKWFFRYLPAIRFYIYILSKFGSYLINIPDYGQPPRECAIVLTVQFYLVLSLLFSKYLEVFQVEKKLKVSSYNLSKNH